MSLLCERRQRGKGHVLFLNLKVLYINNQPRPLSGHQKKNCLQEVTARKKLFAQTTHKKIVCLEENWIPPLQTNNGPSLSYTSLCYRTWLLGNNFRYLVSTFFAVFRYVGIPGEKMGYIGIPLPPPPPTGWA